MKDNDPGFLPRWRKHSKYEYGRHGVTVRSHQATGQRIVAQYEDDGEIKNVSVPHQPYERWIDPAGFICPLVVSPNRLNRPDPTYAAAIRASKANAGWLPYDEVPTGVASVSGVSTMDEWTVRREVIIKERRERRDKHERDYEKAYQARESLIANKTGEELAKAIRSIAPALADAVDQIGQKRGRQPKAE